MTAIYKRELAACFHSFIGSLFIGVTLFLLGIYFSVYDLFMGYPYIGYALSSVVFLFLISIPVLTMRILAEEKRQKTDQLILTAPVSVSGIVVGKFLALATIFAIPIVIICFYPLLLSFFGTVSFGESYLAILGFFLYGLACIAICVFISSLAESQVIAAVLSFGILFLGYVMSGLCNMISSTGNTLTKFLDMFDMVGRFDALLNGSLQLASIVYYLTIVILFLIFTVQSIQKRRYQVTTRTISMSVYSSSVVIISTAAAVLFNVLVGELPSRFTVFDVTSNQLYSLTDDTKIFLSELEEDITIYVLANEKQADTTLAATLQGYRELSDHIKISYVDPAVNPRFYTNYTDSQLNANSIIVESSKRSKVIDYSDIYQSEIDYSTYSQTITGYDGEGQLTSAIAYVITEEMPKVYILEGHGELSFDSTFTSVIEKQNIDYETINLMNYDKVPKDADCVILNAPTSDLSDDDTNKMIAYMEQGGDVLLISTYTGINMTNFNRLLAFYDVSITEGLIIEADTDYYYQDPFFLLPEISYDSVTESIYQNGGYVFVPYAQGLTVNENEEVSVASLLSASDSCYVRNGAETSTSYEKQENDLEGPFQIGVKCEKAAGEETSTGMIYTSESIFTQEADVMVSGNNRKLFSGTLLSLTEHTVSTAVPVKSYEISYLTISQSTIVALALLTTIIIPFAILIAGFMIWFRRRKQ